MINVSFPTFLIENQLLERYKNQKYEETIWNKNFKSYIYVTIKAFGATGLITPDPVKIKLLRVISNFF